MAQHKKDVQQNFSPLKNTKRFVLVIGEEGGILSYFKDGKLDNRLFATLSDQEGLKQFKALLAKDPKAPISILIDVLDQSYSQQSLPAVSMLTINKLVKKRLERDYAPTDLKGSIYIGRSKTGRRDWNFIFASCPFTSPVSDWLDIVLQIPNPFTGFYLLPIEIRTLVQKLDKVFFPDRHSSKKSLLQKTPPAQKTHWQLFVSNNKVGGIRQVAFKDGNILFTRLISIDNEESPNFIAGNIDQEVSNSIEYLKRTTLRDDDLFDVYIITSEAIKNALTKIKIRAKNVILLTPYEAAINLDYNTVAKENDKFSDILISATFTESKPGLKLNIPGLKTLMFMETLNKWISYPSWVIAITVVIYIVLFAYNIYSLPGDIRDIKAQKHEITQRLEAAQKDAKIIGDVSKISDVTKLYKLLTDSTLPPTEPISHFGQIKGDNVLVKSLKWSLEEDPQADLAETSSQPMPIIAHKAGFKLVFELQFFNRGEGYQELFDDFDQFVRRLETNFSEYDIEYSRLASKINLNETDKMLPVQVTISGPKSNTNIKR